MRLEHLHIIGQFKNIENLQLDFSDKKGITLLIGNNGSGKSNILEAISSIFAGLYSTKYKTNFAYEIKYTLRGQKIIIKYDGSTHTLLVNAAVTSLEDKYLPSQVVCSYSGEESRLWNEYYEPFYLTYTEELIKGSSTGSKMVYINKYYWNVALATFYMYDFSVFTGLSNFCSNVLGIKQVNSIKFTFDNDAIKTWKSNPVTELIEELNPEKKPEIQYTVEELKKKFERLLTGGGESLFFRYLAAAFLPKGSKIITGIDININNDLSATSLSEGEKKMVLVQAVLEIVSDENSLILLDEPDSHVHISRKADFQKLISSYEKRDNIITTHSPTLTHAFDTVHIMMLGKNAQNNVIIESKDKQDIIRQLTDNIWSYQEQTLFLTTKKDVLLLEGKNDVQYLKKALQTFQKAGDFEGLELEFIPCGGASNVINIMNQFAPDKGRKTIILFDNDQAGSEAVKEICDAHPDKRGKSSYDSIKSKGYGKVADYWVGFYPKHNEFKGGNNFCLEDYFRQDLIIEYFKTNFKSIESIRKQDFAKKAIENSFASLADSEFILFGKLFDLILEIKGKS